MLSICISGTTPSAALKNSFSDVQAAENVLLAGYLDTAMHTQ